MLRTAEFAVARRTSLAGFFSKGYTDSSSLREHAAPKDIIRSVLWMVFSSGTFLIHAIEGSKDR